MYNVKLELQDVKLKYHYLVIKDSFYKKENVLNVKHQEMQMMLDQMHVMIMLQVLLEIPDVEMHFS